MLLSLAIWVPIVAGLVVFALGGDRHAALQRWVALVGAILGFLVTIPLYTGFDLQNPGFQFEEKWMWIERFNIHYHLGVDGISVLFVLLNSFITILVVIAGWSVIDTRVGQYYGAFLVMSGLLNGVFEALDAVLFYVFFEGTLIPMFIIIGVWGGPNRVYAAVKFFLYTLLGSLLMLVAMLYLYNKSGGSFAITDWHRLPLSLAADGALLRLPLRLRGQGADVAGAHLAAGRAHRGADRRLGGARGDPAEARGLRLCSLHAAHPAGRLARARLADDRAVARRDRLHRPRDPGADRHEAPHRLFVGLAHGLRHARLLHLQRLRVEGGLVQMISHGFVSAAMFLCVGVLYDRMHTRMIGDYGGVVNTMPKFASFMMLFAMANAGLPATSGFVGEFMVIMGAMKANFWLAFVAATTLVLGAAYTLWMYKRVIFGAVANSHVGALKDLNPREFVVLGALAAAVLLMGVYPRPFTEVMHASVNELLRHIAVTKMRNESSMNWTLIIDHLPALPEGIVLAGACALMIFDLYVKDERRAATLWFAQAILLLAAAATVFVLWGSNGKRLLIFNDLFVADAMGHLLKLVCYVAVSAALVYSRQYLADRGLLRGEFVTLLLFSLLGMMVMISAASFLTLFLGLELMSLCLYALVALNRDSSLSTEAAMKYFVLGALSSGLLLYGMSMIYGATGTLNIYEVAAHAGRLAATPADRTFLVFGLVFVVAGLAFKVGVVPFHMWIPDVYHGAPTAVTLIVGSAPKLAAFAMAMRLLVNGLIDLAQDWQQMLALLALLSMALGNITAIAQSNLKRMLAYSTIAHMGFMLLGLLRAWSGATG